MKVQNNNGQNPSGKSVPLPLFLAVLILLIIVSCYSFFPGILSSEATAKSQKTPDPPRQISHQIRLNRYEYTKPLILTESKENPAEFSDLKGQLLELINEKTNSGEIQSAGIYIRRFSNGVTIKINDQESYNPGSIAKISILMAYMRMAEKNPKVLDETFSLANNEYAPIHQEFPSEEIVFNKKYTVKELLNYMIIKSSNSATVLLSKYMDDEVFQELYSDLGFQDVSLKDNPNYQINADGVSRFMRVLYNSSYLLPEDSEFALSLLAKTEFREGMVKTLPPNTKVAHKFGEQGDFQYKQLHETGIVYINNNPYLVTVMSKGKDMKNLTNFIATVSQLVYNRFNQAN